MLNRIVSILENSVYQPLRYIAQRVASWFRARVLQSVRRSRYFQRFGYWWATWNFTPQTRQRVYRKLASLLENGVRLSNAVDMLRQQTAQNVTSPRYVVFTEIWDTLRSGEGLAEGLRQFVPPGELMLIEAGERAGRLPEVLRQTAKSVEGRMKMRKAIRNSLFYPTLLFAASIALLYFIGSVAIPRLARLSDPSSWSGAAAWLHSLSQFVRSYEAMGVLAAFVVFFLWVLWTLSRRLYPGVRKYLDKIPPWSLYRLTVGSGFMIALSATIRAGIPQQEALLQMREYSSPYLEERIEDTYLALREGSQNIGTALKETGHDFPDREVINDMAIYADLPDFEEVLARYGEEWIDKAVERIRTQGSILNTIGILFIAGVIGFVVLGMFSIQQEIAGQVGI